MLPLNEETFERVARSLPQWARASAEAGWAAFDSLPMPDSHQEEWRYVEVDVDLAALHLPETAGAPLPAARSLVAGLDSPAGRAVNVDGRTVAVAAGDGVGLSSLAAGVAGDGEAVRRAFRSGPPPGLDRFSAAHHAFAADGVFLHLAPGHSPAGPLHLGICHVER